MRVKTKKGLLLQALLVILLSFGLALVAGCGGGGGGGGGGDPIVGDPGGGNGDDPNGGDPGGGNGGDPPVGTTFTVVDDAYTWLGNTAITVPAANGVLANDVATDGTATFDTTNTLGTVDTTGLTGGSFSYTPPTNAVLPFTDTFTYTATDGTTQQSGTVTITINQQARFVRNNFTGTSDGSLTAPFTSLTAAANASGPGDIIFVFAGDGTRNNQNVGIDLQADQKLIGEGVGLTFDVVPNGTPLAEPLTVVPAGNPPTIADTTNIVENIPIIGLDSGVEVAGIIVDGADAISNMDGMSGAGITGFNLHDNVIRNVQRAGIELDASGGTGMITANVIEDLLGGDTDNAINITNSAAGVDLTISGNTLNRVSETGIRVQFASGGTVAVTNNTLTDVGTIAGSRGIDIDGAGTTTISGNSVDNTGGTAVTRSGIQLNATGTLAASVIGNTVLNAGSEGGEGGIEAQTAAAATLCLRMTGNTTDSGFILDNRGTNNTPASFQIEGPERTDFEAANLLTGGIFDYLLDINAVSFVPIGTCGFTP